MSISVRNITKFYGSQKALDGVSIEIKPGEIVGLLGPNGAGKSTLMKILTCFLPPTSGEAFICSYDVLEQSIEARKKVGYLPENNPLYLDLYVKEFLEFIAGLHQLKRNARQRINDMIELTGLQLEQNKKIGALSKGYRQRVGLAQALLHDPVLLILDEPTSGLDPVSSRTIDELIDHLRVTLEVTSVVVTHDLHSALSIGTRIAMLTQGKIIELAEPAEFVKSNVEEVQLFLEAQFITVRGEWEKNGL